MSYLEKAKDIYTMLSKGQFLEAFDKYYDKNVVMVEADGKTREGIAENRKAQEDFLSMVKEFHGGGLTSVASNESEGITIVESWMDITFNDSRRNKMEEVAVQKWQGDKIIHERFYYNMPQPAQQQSEIKVEGVESNS